MTSERRVGLDVYLCWTGFVLLLSYFIHVSQPEEFMGLVATRVARNTKTMSGCTSKIMETHYKARCNLYPREKDVFRFPVPDDKVKWSVDFPEYKPTNFTSSKVLSKPGTEKKKLNRISHHGKYEVIDGVPRNPVGRTGLRGRGCLGRYGPNHAADPIVTRWLRDTNGDVIKDGHGKPVLEFVAIQRQDCGEWALPGGMVEAGEKVSLTIKREFGEEAMSYLEASDEEKNKISEAIDDLFKNGLEVYSGYVDDPRNTDNCWMETVAVNFHDENGNSVSKIALKAGDDAVGVKWVVLNKDIKLYASHSHLMEQVATKRNASWERPSSEQMQKT
ncbi:hypothetical protein KUTeg_010360 [Tegillarca granosa]|uniref:Nudix hydrolase domain-containing protein n=1 Tax=Tegillarca granosa TaxID=220873 RepID=A0ABQ9FAW6_TEGGR|nr:hypothetical protein KUTeg_010360 [Tegillarca granosa]